jgi:protein-disulfide isomerase
MSRKSQRNQANPPQPVQQPPRKGLISRRGIFIGAAMALLLVFVVATLVYRSEKVQSAQQAAAKASANLASAHSPTLGKPDARVHIVEFLDPACGTCAEFYPQVKKLLEANPDRIRLSIRHVPFHAGSDQVVRILEAARRQDKYWQTLEALFATQNRWVFNHVVQADQVWPLLGGIGLDFDRIRADMNAPEIANLIERDLADARVLGVTMTPEYFVNGRPLPSFGLKELQSLVKEELSNAY